MKYVYPTFWKSDSSIVDFPVEENEELLSEQILLITDDFIAISLS